MNSYIIEIGNFSIRWYSFLILVGALLAIFLVERESKRFNIDKEFSFNLCFWSIIFGILGARAYYVIFNYNIYKGDVFSIFKIWEGGLAIHGGIIAGILTIYFYCKKYNVSYLKMFDIATPALIIAQAIGRWGNFFNQEAHGIAVSLNYFSKYHIPKFIMDGMYISGTYYEPLFLYESILCLIGFVLLIIIRRLKKTKNGTCTSLYLIYYGMVRFFIESRRTDSLMLGGFKMAQIISIAMIVCGIIILSLKYKKGRFEDLYNNVKK